MEGVHDFVPSPNRNPGHVGPVVAVVIHDEEYPEKTGAARDVAAFFARSSTQASTTASIDADEIIGSVDYPDTAWHTGLGRTHNSACEGYEHSGYAKQTRDEWLDPYGVKMLDRSAAHVAWRCHALGIPPRKIDGAQYLRALEAGDPAQGGILGHADVTRGTGLDPSGHWDPGPNFPWDWYIARVVSYYGGEEPVAPVPTIPDPVVYRRNGDGSVGVLAGTVTEVQSLLAEVAASVSDPGMDPGAVDGIFGPKTEAAVIAFQARAKDLDGNPLQVDGIVGPKTIASLRVCAYLVRVGQAAPAPATAEVPSFPAPLGVYIARGERSSRVTRVQTRLRDRGWAIDVDGVFGEQTERVVRLFQSEKGLAVDGIVGPQTWATLWIAPIT